MTCHIAVHDKLTAFWSLLPENLHECSGNIATANAGPIPAYLLLFPPICPHCCMFAPIPAYLPPLLHVCSHSRLLAPIPAYLLPFPRTMTCK